MIVIPSLEVSSGALVRLRGNELSQAEVLADDVHAVARAMQREGAMFFHVVDLDAVFGVGRNDEVLRQLADAMLPFQVRGGVDSAERAAELLALGADRVVLGSLLRRDPQAARQLGGQFGHRVMAALDVGPDRDFEQGLAALLEAGIDQVIYNQVDERAEDAPLDYLQLSRLLQQEELRTYLRCTVGGGVQPEQLGAQAEGLLGLILNHAGESGYHAADAAANATGS